MKTHQNFVFHFDNVIHLISRTFGEMKRNVAHIAASLKHLGVGPGDRVRKNRTYVNHFLFKITFIFLNALCS